MLRQEAIAKTSEPSVAYKYVGGLKGFPIKDDTRVDVPRVLRCHGYAWP